MDNLTELYSINRGSFKFCDKDGNEYIKNMFMPSIIAMFSPDDFDSDEKYQWEILSAFLMGQFDFMNSEWVKENLSLGIQNEMMLRVRQRNLEDQEILKKRLEMMMPERNLKKK